MRIIIGAETGALFVLEILKIMVWLLQKPNFCR